MVRNIWIPSSKFQRVSPDFRTHVSGVEPKHIQKQQAMEVTACREQVAAILKGKVLVGHALQNDLHAFFFNIQG
jgi:RNA exonuclease 4